MLGELFLMNWKLILTADCSVYFIWTHWFCILILAFEMGHTAGATGRQGMLTPPRHLIPPLVFPEVRVCSILGFVFPTGFMRLITFRYLCYFILFMDRHFQHWRRVIFDLGLTAGVAGRRRMLTLPSHLILPLLFSGVCVVLHSTFYLLFNLWLRLTHC
jgi:hypothetical protein